MKNYILLVALFFHFGVHGQKIKADSSKKAITTPKSYSEIIPANSITKDGLIIIHKVQDQVFFELPVNLMGKEILVVNRIAKSASGTDVFAGDELNNMVIEFEKRPDNKLLIRKEFYRIYNSDSAANTFRAINRSNVMPIVASLPIETYGKDSSVVVNMTSHILGDNELFSFSASNKALLKVTSLVADKTYLEELHSFPLNSEISTLKTYLKTSPIAVIIDGEVSRSTANENVTFELNTSFVLLPAKPMRQRLADERVGYFALNQVDFETIPQGVFTRSFIKRWRLEPKAEDLDKYNSGELVEPVKPIVFYIDPATPQKWLPYLMEGINDWQPAFERAGFKNAIFAKTAPTPAEDSSWSLFDARHSAIIYKPSEVENASGPSIADPRTGEIIESHINWHHNVMQLIHDWYMLQCGLSDTAAQTMNFSDSLMGQLIRFVISHEVGHALGLRHNMGASTTIEVAKLRDKKWVEANGFCPSIMDYARFNYVAQPEDSISRKGLLPRISVYDKWAIDWGYRILSKYETPEQEKHFLNDWVIKQSKDKRLQYISESSWDIRSKVEDIGDNPVVASNYGIANLKRTVPLLCRWTKVPDEDFSNLHHMYLMLQRQYRTYVNHVITAMGRGIYENLKSVEQPGPVYSPIPTETWKSFYQFINDHVFTTPTWMLDTTILYRTGQTRLGVIGNIQELALRQLLSNSFLGGIYSRLETNYDIKNGVSVNEYFRYLRRDVWKELDTHEKVDMYRKNLQKYYVKYLLMAFNVSKPNMIVSLPYTGFTELYSSEITSIIYGHIKELESDIKKQLPFIKDKETRDHFQYLSYKMQQYLKEDNKMFGY